MAIKIKTNELTPESIEALDRNHRLWIYNGLDCCLTHEIFEVLWPKCQQDENASLIYHFERALQGPVLEMMIRGFEVDNNWRNNVLCDLEKRINHLEITLDEFAQAIQGKPLNAQSPQQLKRFFYEYLHLPEQYKRSKGKKTVSCGEEALRNLRAYFLAKPFCNIILAIRGLSKLHSALASGVDNDGKMRTSFNISGTETGRFSSSENCFGTGTNFQNITAELRRAFISSGTKKIGVRDLAQAESRVAGIISWLCSGKDGYLQACDSGDLHTTVTKMVRKELPWTGDLKHDKEIAETKVPGRSKSYRDFSKNLGHGTNYYGKAFTLSRIIGVDVAAVEDFQERYFSAFPELREWHQKTATLLQSTGCLVTPLGRKRYFFGRLGDDSTLREAIAYGPQSTIADYMDLGLYICWADPVLRKMGFEIIAQVHDALVFQYPPEFEEQVLRRVEELMSQKIKFTHPDTGQVKEFFIPSDCKIGWNWGPCEKKNDLYEDGNPFGLKAWDGKPDTRLPPSRESTTASLLDRRIC